MSAWTGGGRTLSVESKWTVFKRRLLQYQPRENRGQQVPSSFPAPKMQTQIDGRKAFERHWLPGEKVSLERKVRKCAKVTSKEIARIRHAISGILPCVKITHLNRDAHSATNICSDTLGLMGSRVKSRRNVVGQDQLPY